MLSAGSAGAVDLHLNIGRIKLNVHRLHFREYRHRGGTGLELSV